jgi:hypothetical protein
MGFSQFTTDVEMEQIGERTRSRGQLEQDLGPRRVPGGAIVLVAGARNPFCYMNRSRRVPAVGEIEDSHQLAA